MNAILENFDTLTLVVIAILALLTSAVHGATGVGGGFLLSALLAPIVGVAPIVPVVSVSLLISHSSRAILNIENFDKSAFLAVAVPAVPCICATAFLYGRMSSSLIAVILGCVILISIPVRRWAKARQIKASRRTLQGVGAIYGGLAGVSISPGMILVPFMLGHGLTKEQFVATMAVIALLANVIRVGVFGATDLLNSQYILIGVLCGIMTIPGNWIGRTVLRRMTNDSHSRFVDILVVLGALNFFWLAVR